MRDFPFDIVGFDLDGTLFDTAADLAGALNHVLGMAGRPPLPVEAVKPMIGRGGLKMVEEGLEATGECDPAERDRLFPEWLAFYEANIARHSRPYPGALAAMDMLDARGVKLAIVTNKRERFGTKLVTELGLASRFAALIGGDTMGPGNGKPSRVPIDEMIRRCGGGRAAFVGDSTYDTRAARNAGIPSVAVSFGFADFPVGQLGADAVIDHFDQLVPTLERLGG